MSEAADIAELLAAGFARAGRPTKVVLQKSLLRALILLPLLSDVLPMLLLIMTRRLLILLSRNAARFARASRPTKIVLQKSLPRPLMQLLSDLLPMPRLRITMGLLSLQSQRRLMVTWIKCMDGRTQMVLFKVRVCLLSCAEEVCFKNVNAA